MERLPVDRRRRHGRLALSRAAIRRRAGSARAGHRGLETGGRRSGRRGERLGVDGRARSSCSSGRRARYKGVDDLADAVARLDRQDVVLALVGTEPDATPAAPSRRAIRASASSAEIPFPDVPRYLAAADVVAVPQRNSSDTRGQMPAKLFDAMALGRPIVSTRVSMIPEILDGCGMVVPPGDVPALRRAIEYLLDHPDEAARARAEGAGAMRGRVQLHRRPEHAVPAGRACHERRMRDAVKIASSAGPSLPRWCRDRDRRARARARPARPRDRVAHDRGGRPSARDHVRSVPVVRQPSMLRVLSFALAARRSRPRRATTSCRATSARCDRTSIAPARARTARTWPRWGAARGSIRTTGSCARSSGASSVSGRRGTSSRSRAAARPRSRPLRDATRSCEPDLQRRGPPPLSSRQPRAGRAGRRAWRSGVIETTCG